MADWTDINLDTLLPGEPLTSAKIIAAVENPKAIAEGAPGAPKVTGLALEIFKGEWTTTTTTTMVTITGLDDDGLLMCSGMTTKESGTGSVDITYETSTDGGSTWSSSVRFFPQLVTFSEKSLVRVLDVSGSVNAIRFLSIFSGDAAGICFIGVSTIGRSVA